MLGFGVVTFGGEYLRTVTMPTPRRVAVVLLGAAVAGALYERASSL
jgi:hypothetical protein